MTIHTVPLGTMKMVSIEYVEKKVNFNTFTDESYLSVEALRGSDTKFLYFFFMRICLPSIRTFHNEYILELFYYDEDNKITFSSENKQEIVDLINLINSHKYINYEEEEA